MQVNGWELFAPPQLLDQLEKSMSTVEKLKAKKTDQSSATFKVLASLYELMFVTIPADPTRPEYRQGDALGDEYKHWFRARFGGQRFRLFFRFDTRAKVIIYAWVNAEDTSKPTARRTAPTRSSGRAPIISLDVD